MSKNNGGPAFPGRKDDGHYYHGMTLRDWFAAKAMQSLIDKYDEPWRDIAIQAYEMADAMLAEREKGDE